MKKYRVGEVLYNQQNLKMEIIQYYSCSNITIKFEDGTIVKNIKYGNFIKRRVKNPNNPEVYGVGFIGQGEYIAHIGRANTPIYVKWKSMINRCYNKKFQNKRPTYINCEVCNEWHNFQNFAEWYEDNLWSEDCTVLDKDIVIKGNKVYSPETCVLVDARINMLFLKRDAKRGNCLIGVYKKPNCFVAQCSTSMREQQYLGQFKTEIEAFNAYKIFKEDCVKQVANEYKNKYPNFPDNLYQAMMNYEVKTTD